MVTVLLFATLKDAVGHSQIELTLPENATVADLKRALVLHHPQLQKWLPHVRVAVAQEYAHDNSPVADGAEVALIPPVSGGSDATDEAVQDLSASAFVRVGAGQISLDEVVGAVQNSPNAPGNHAGAICTFLGVVRDHSTDPQGRTHSDILELNYEAYAPMAERELARICAEATEKWGATCAVTHRIGLLKVGEASVAIAVATPHRAAAFEACRYVIEELKKRVPIWKKETAASGFWWVEGSAG